MGKHGLAVDCLRGVELITATGEIVRASADEHPDLFWAVRGGGGNFGVATWLEYELYPVGPTVTAGLVAHPFSAARDVLRFYRDFTESLPDELTAFAGLLHAPDGSGTKLAAILVCHAGSPEAGAAAVAPVKRFGSPVMDVIGPMPYTAVNMMVDGGFPKGALNYWKSNFLAGLPDAAIETMIERFETVPSPMSGLLLEHFHGAATRVSPTATAFPHRTVGYNFLAVSEWLTPSATKDNAAWARMAYAAMAPHFAAGRYVNYLNVDEVGEGSAAEAAFGPNGKRLREVKRGYDPDNIFHLNQNIKP
jgi:FAD/FMN-containing dehydrogenase